MPEPPLSAPVQETLVPAPEQIGELAVKFVIVGAVPSY